MSIPADQIGTNDHAKQSQEVVENHFIVLTMEQAFYSKFYVRIVGRDFELPSEVPTRRKRFWLYKSVFSLTTQIDLHD